MAKTILGILAILLTSGLASGQTIDDIQYYNPITGAPESPHDLHTVTVTGTVVSDGDTYDTPPGAFYIQGLTGGIRVFPDEFGTLMVGDVVEITGPVGTWRGEIEIVNEDFLVTGSVPEPEPILMTPEDLITDYESVGSFVSVTGLVTTKDPNQFTLAAGDSTDLIIYIDYDTGIDLGNVDIGDIYKVKGPVTVYFGKIEVLPRMQSDLIETCSGLEISGVGAVNYVPLATENIIIRATITDDSAVSSAILNYRHVQGEIITAWYPVDMVSSGDIYIGEVPGPHNLSQVDYFIEARDDEAHICTSPENTPTDFYEIAVGLTPIYTVQYVHPDSTNQDSRYLNKVINIKGVVTAGTNVCTSPETFIVQAQDTGPYGGYAYGGLLVYEASATNEYSRGDVVEIGGYIREYFGLTEIVPHNADAVNLISQNGDLPEPERVTIKSLVDNVLTDGNGKLGEAWESVWVKTFVSAVMDTIGLGNFTIKDSGVDNLIVSPASCLTYVPTIGEIIRVESYMSSSNGTFTISPISDEFIELTGATPVDDTPAIEMAGGFRSIVPNPFNPATKISFVVNTNDLVQLDVYNLRGERVRTLVHDRLLRNEYTFTWDGTNDAGQSVASGNYFARLQIGQLLTQVRKLSLVK